MFYELVADRCAPALCRRHKKKGASKDNSVVTAYAISAEFPRRACDFRLRERSKQAHASETGARRKALRTREFAESLHSPSLFRANLVVVWDDLDTDLAFRLVRGVPHAANFPLRSDREPAKILRGI